MKTCPHCKKQIPDRAVKCKYCYNYLDKEDKDNQKEEIYTKNKKILTAEESKELKELEEFNNKNSNSLLGEVTGYLGCGMYLIIILAIILSLCIDDFDLNGRTGFIMIIITCICFLFIMVSSTILLYRETKNYIKYTGINIYGGSVSYWIPIVHYIYSPKLIEQIGEKFSNDKKFSKHLAPDYHVNKWINLLYSFALLFAGYFIIVGLIYHPENEYFNMSDYSDGLTYYNVMIFFTFLYTYYIGHYLGKLTKINECIQGRISELKGEDQIENKDEEKNTEK